MADISPFEISISDERISDLKQRLELATFPDELDKAGWDYGSPLADVKKLTAHWKDAFDWRKAEKKLNELPQFIAKVQCEGFENLDIHFVHQKSKIDGAIPLLFVHGWPGSFIEVSKILLLLSKGGDDKPAFNIVAPSLPNFGFSQGSKKRGFGLKQLAETCHKLMLKLGYNQYVTQGGDLGTWVTRFISLLYPPHCPATHLNMDISPPPFLTASPFQTALHALTPYSPAEKAGFARNAWFATEGFGYYMEQSTRPQTIAYALASSPVALLAWIYEKLHDWTDSYPWTPDEVCTWISIYWFSTAGPGANVRIYYEATHPTGPGALNSMEASSWISHVKLGVSHFPKDLNVLPSWWCKALGKVVFEKTHDQGGHFAAWERPEELVSDVRTMFGRKGGAYGVVKGRDGYAGFNVS